jgi:hypothetical protein
VDCPPEKGPNNQKIDFHVIVSHRAGLPLASLTNNASSLASIQRTNETPPYKKPPSSIPYGSSRSMPGSKHSETGSTISGCFQGAMALISPRFDMSRRCQEHRSAPWGKIAGKYTGEDPSKRSYFINDFFRVLTSSWPKDLDPLLPDLPGWKYTFLVIPLGECAWLIFGSSSEELPQWSTNLSFGLRFWHHLPPNLAAKSDSKAKPKMTPKSASRF